MILLLERGFCGRKTNKSGYGKTADGPDIEIGKENTQYQATGAGFSGQ